MIKGFIRSIKNWIFSDSIREVIVILFVIFLIRTFGFGLYQVPSGSMETTMLVGERFFADKFTILFSPPKHGDIISFNAPTFPYSKNWLVKLWQNYAWGPDNWTKRVIGVPGDTIKGVIEDGKPVVYRNGVKLVEPYVNKYPLINVWKVDPLAYRKFLKDLSRYGNSSVEVLRERIAAQKFSDPYQPRSYDPSVSYEDQPFYRTDGSKVVRINEQGYPDFGRDGKIMLVNPGEAMSQNPERLVRKGRSYWSSSDEFYVELGDDEYWAMGDNRRGSFDSRFFGPVKSELIHGKILFRIWSLDSNESWWIIDLLKHPIDFWKRMRWGRFLQIVK